MKKYLLFLFMIIGSIMIVAGCSSSSEQYGVEALDSKHEPLPDYVLDSSEFIQEAYVMAAHHPEVVEAVPCYCNCYESAGHMNNRACFIQDMGPNNEVTEWDPHGKA